MLVGTRDPGELERDAPRVNEFADEGMHFAGATFVQALFEIEAREMCAMLPPALHPTLPPVAGYSVFDIPESPWGRFRMAQLRIECRSGLRPRGLLVGGVIDNPDAGQALTETFGFRLTGGEVELARAYDETAVQVSVDGVTWLSTSMKGPQRIGEADTQFVSSMHPATTERGFRLLQVDTRMEVHRAERARLTIRDLDAAAWGESRIVPTLALPGVVGIADIRLDPIRFACRADVMAFEGSEVIR